MADLPEIPVTATNTRAVVEALMGQPVTIDVIGVLLGSPTTGGCNDNQLNQGNTMTPATTASNATTASRATKHSNAGCSIHS
jgi:hypothetical protein